MTGLIGVSIGTGGVSMTPGPGVSDEPQGWGVEASAQVGEISVGSVEIPAVPAAALPGDVTVT